MTDLLPFVFWQGGTYMGEDQIADGYDAPEFFFEAVGNLFVRNKNFHITLMKVRETAGARLLIPQAELICPLGNVPGHIAEVLKATARLLPITPIYEIREADIKGRH